MLQSLKRLLRATNPAQLSLLLTGPPRTAEALLQRLRSLGLPSRITRLRLTRNRNVMVSFGADELRAHEGYLDAPDDILAAIVVFVAGSTRRARLEGRRRLLAYPIRTAAPHRRRGTRTHPDDQQLAEKLTRFHGEYNARYFGGMLKPLDVRVSRRMRARLGQYTATSPLGDPPEIAISRRHLRRDGWEETLQTLLHEMVHQWQDERGLDIDHGPTFRAKARELGIPASARRVIDEPALRAG
jgi:hypothetical protein